MAGYAEVLNARRGNQQVAAPAMPRPASPQARKQLAGVKKMKCPKCGHVMGTGKKDSDGDYD